MSVMSRMVLIVAAMATLQVSSSLAIGAEIHQGRKLLQGAGVGAGCNSVATQADNGVGYTVKDSENTLAGDMTGAKGAGKKLLSALGFGPHRSLLQGAGVGAGCDSVLTQADNGVGYTVEDGENTLAGDSGGHPMMGGVGTGKKLLADTHVRSLQQTDKAADGAANVLSAAGLPQQGGAVKTIGDDYDGQTTNDFAAEGQQIGNAEASIPEVVKAVPGRKLSGLRSLKQTDKMADGAANVLSAAGLPQQGGAVKTVGDDYDGQTTNDFAADGQMIGNAEASIPEVVKAVPGRK